MRLLRVRFTLRWMMIAVAFAACIGAVGLGLIRRAERLRRAADYHDQAAAVLVLEAGGPISTTGLTSADVEATFRSRGPSAWEAMQAARYHEALAEKYAAAASSPWLPAAADPQPPPGAHPQFALDPRGATDRLEGFR